MEGGEMVTRTTLVGVVAAAALVGVPVAQAQSLADAHQRQGLATTTQGSKTQPVGTTTLSDAHSRASLPAQQPVVVVAAGSFDWGDAAIGAASGVGFAFLLVGLGLLLLSQRTRTRIATH
jgi:hypothetical protein